MYIQESDFFNPNYPQCEYRLNELKNSLIFPAFPTFFQRSTVNTKYRNAFNTNDRLSFYYTLLTTYKYVLLYVALK